MGKLRPERKGAHMGSKPDLGLEAGLWDTDSALYPPHTGHPQANAPRPWDPSM